MIHLEFLPPVVSLSLPQTELFFSKDPALFSNLAPDPVCQEPKCRVSLPPVLLLLLTSAPDCVQILLAFTLLLLYKLSLKDLFWFLG